MITAVGARELQKEGISQREHYKNMMMRCEAAIIDHARKQCPRVEVMVMKLASETLQALVEELESRGFRVLAVPRGSDSHVLSISWEIKELLQK